VSISSLTDAITYNCSAYADNGSATGGQAWSAAVKGITIDNTAPVCSISVSYPIIHKDGPQLLTWSITDALSLVSNSVTITRPSPGSVLSYTSATATSLLFSDSNTTYVGTYSLSASGTDRAGNTCSATTSFKADQPGGTFTVPTETETTTNNTKTIVIIALVLIGAFLLFRKKK